MAVKFPFETEWDLLLLFRAAIFNAGENELRTNPLSLFRHRKCMKLSYLILPLAVSGCVNLEFPGLVSDTAKLSKDAYGAIVGKKDSKDTAKQEPAKPVQEAVKPATESAIPAAKPSEYVTNTYIGHESQSIVDIKQKCVSEAAEKIIKLVGKDARYTVVENSIATVNNSVVANCRLAIDKAAVDTPVAQQ